MRTPVMDNKTILDTKIVKVLRDYTELKLSEEYAVVVLKQVFNEEVETKAPITCPRHAKVQNNIFDWFRRGKL